MRLASGPAWDKLINPRASLKKNPRLTANVFLQPLAGAHDEIAEDPSEMAATLRGKRRSFAATGPPRRARLRDRP